MIAMASPTIGPDAAAVTMLKAPVETELQLTAVPGTDATHAVTHNRRSVRCILC